MRRSAVHRGSVLACGLLAVSAAACSSTARQPAAAPPSSTGTPTAQAACAATLPAAWTAAFEHSPISAGGRTAIALSVAPDGSVAALRDDGVRPGSGREVVQVRPDKQVRTLYAVPHPDQLTARSAWISGHVLVVGLAADQRPAKGVTPGSTPIGLRAVVVVDLVTGRPRVLAGHDSASVGEDVPNIQTLVMIDGIAYWDTESSYGSTRGMLHSYDLATGLTGTARTVYSGRVGWPVAGPAGVGWPDPSGGGFRFAVTHPLPSAVETAMTAFSRPRLATDAVAYAWLATSSLVGWWAPGHAPTYVKLPRPVSTESGYGGILVAGHIVLTATPAAQVLDVSTRALAPMPTTGVLGPKARGALLDAAGPVLAGNTVIGPSGHFVDGYWADAPTAPLRIDLSGLPPLRC